MIFYLTIKRFFLKKRKIIIKFSLFLLWAASIIAILAALYLYLNQKPEASCPLKADHYKCFEVDVSAILETQGIDSSIKYIKVNVVDRDGGYTLAHMLLHYVGDYAYIKTNDLDKTLYYIYPYIKNNPAQVFYDGYDGFFHGAISEYFIQNNHKTPNELINSVCTRNFGWGDVMWRVPDCYHTIGHAVMASNSNDLLKSLDICDSLSYEFQITNCYYGTFMENAHLYSPLYHPGLPRPYVKYPSMLALCSGFNDTKALKCSMLIGQSILMNSSDDIDLGYSECDKINESDPNRPRYRECIKSIAYLFVTSKYKSNFKAMIQSCKSLKYEFQGDCLNYVSRGIKISAAGKKYDNFDFCGLVEKKLRTQCLK